MSQIPNNYTSLGRYQNDFDEHHLIGSGAFGCVYNVQNKIDKECYAIKKVSINEQNKTKKIREVEILAKLRGEYVVNYKTSWIEDNIRSKILYIQMELCSDDLKNVIKSKAETFGRKSKKDPMNPIEYFISCELFKEVLECVKYLHELVPQILHRDLKPSNILISYNNTNGMCLKICDFGLATIHDKDSITHTKYLGTFCYIAPEVCFGKYDSKADVYSLGVIALELFNSNINSSNFGLDYKTNLKPNSKKAIETVILSMVNYIRRKRPTCADILSGSNEWSLCLNKVNQTRSWSSIVIELKKNKNMFYFKYLENKLRVNKLTKSGYQNQTINGTRAKQSVISKELLPSETISTNTKIAAVCTKTNTTRNNLPSRNSISQRKVKFNLKHQRKEPSKLNCTTQRVTPLPPELQTTKCTKIDYLNNNIKFLQAHSETVFMSETYSGSTLSNQLFSPTKKIENTDSANINMDQSKLSILDKNTCTEKKVVNKIVKLNNEFKNFYQTKLALSSYNYLIKGKSFSTGSEQIFKQNQSFPIKEIYSLRPKPELKNFPLIIFIYNGKDLVAKYNVKHLDNNHYIKIADKLDSYLHVVIFKFMDTGELYVNTGLLSEDHADFVNFNIYKINLDITNSDVNTTKNAIVEKLNIPKSKPFVDRELEKLRNELQSHYLEVKKKVEKNNSLTNSIKEIIDDQLNKVLKGLNAKDSNRDLIMAQKSVLENMVNIFHII